MSPHPGTPAPRRPQDGSPPGRTAGRAGEACLAVLVPLVEIVLGFGLLVALGLRAWGTVGDHKYEMGGEPPPEPVMDWVPVLWVGGFTLAVIAVAVAFLRAGLRIAGTVQVVVAVLALAFVALVWRTEYKAAHPDPLPPCPTAAGVPCREV
ncbi:DUF6234 family protein [Streptomyces sp. NPDC051018]|uniref:DUF6234 family protein n=1 Tax=Streptomyces sp. NPDC051018 TaxID=3365639 RepID=UPI0037A4A957